MRSKVVPVSCVAWRRPTGIPSALIRHRRVKNAKVSGAFVQFILSPAFSLLNDYMSIPKQIR